MWKLESLGKVNVYFGSSSKSSTKPNYVPGVYSANARTVTNIPNLLTNDIKGENPWYIPKDFATTTTTMGEQTKVQTIRGYK